MEVHVLLIEEKPDAYALKCLEGIFANTNQDRGNIKDHTVSLYLFFLCKYELERTNTDIRIHSLAVFEQCLYYYRTP